MSQIFFITIPFSNFIIAVADSKKSNSGKISVKWYQQCYKPTNDPIDVTLLSGKGPRSFLIKFKLPRHNAYYSGFRGLLAAGNTIPVPNGVRDKKFVSPAGDSNAQKSRGGMLASQETEKRELTSGILSLHFSLQIHL